MYKTDYNSIVTPEFIRKVQYSIVDVIIEIELADDVSLESELDALENVNWNGLTAEEILVEANQWKERMRQDSLNRRAKS